MISNKIIFTYATAITEVAVERNEVKKFYEQLKDINESLIINLDFLKILETNDLDLKTKKNIIATTFADSLIQIVNLLKYILDKNDQHYLLAILKETLNSLLKRLGLLNVTITSPFSISKIDLVTIEKKLANKYQKEISSNFVIDKKLIGGIKVEFNGIELTNSIESKIDLIKALNKGNK